MQDHSVYPEPPKAPLQYHVSTSPGTITVTDDGGYIIAQLRFGTDVQRAEMIKIAAELVAARVVYILGAIAK